MKYPDAEHVQEYDANSKGYMRQYQIDLAYTSPLRRAKETAEILLEGRNISLYEDQRVQEISFGSYEGMSCVDKTKEENLAFQKFFQDTGNYIPPEDAESDRTTL